MQSLALEKSTEQSRKLRIFEMKMEKQRDRRKATVLARNKKKRCLKLLFQKTRLPRRKQVKLISA